MSTRVDFVRLLGSGSLAASAARTVGDAPVAPIAPRDPDGRLEGALVLSGGGSRGAYEAGVVAAFVAAAGVSDGTPLPHVDAVVGTSIGALNAYLVATARYSDLAHLWRSVASVNLFTIKRRYRDITDANSGLLNRLYEAIALEAGLIGKLRGVLDRDRVAALIERIVEGDRAPLVPLLFTATNLSDERAEIFYRGPRPVSASVVSAGQAAIESVVDRNARAREAGPDILARALLAATAIPTLFDPVEMTFNGVSSQYVDGGIADNTPVDVARIIAKNVYAVLVDPQQPSHTMYASAVEIGFAAFGVAQRPILEGALRAASLESESKSLFAPTANAEQRAFLSHIFDSRLFTIRPSTELSLAFADFTSQQEIDAAYDRGFADAVAGWQPFRRDVPRIGPSDVRTPVSLSNGTTGSRT